VCTLAGAVGGMNGVEFSSDGKRVVSPSRVNLMCGGEIWDAETGDEVIELVRVL